MKHRKKTLDLNAKCMMNILRNRTQAQGISEFSVKVVVDVA